MLRTVGLNQGNTTRPCKRRSVEALLLAAQERLARHPEIAEEEDEEDEERPPRSEPRPQTEGLSDGTATRRHGRQRQIVEAKTTGVKSNNVCENCRLAMVECVWCINQVKCERCQRLDLECHTVRFGTTVTVKQTPHQVSPRSTVEGAENTMSTWKDDDFSDKHGVKRSATNVRQQNQWPLKTWIKYSLWTFWAIFLMFLLGAGDWAFPDGNNPSCPEDGQKMNMNSATCSLAQGASDGSANLTFLSSFVLGGFLLTSRTLWLTRRSAYCALCGATRNLLVNVTTLAPSRDKKLLARWAVLGYELSVLKARLLIDADEGKRFLELSRLVVGNEWESMVDGDRHTTVWYWIQSKAKQLQDQGDINEYELQTICTAVTLSRDKANDLMSCIDRDQPPPYIFVCAILININLFFHASARGFEWAVWMHDAGVFKVFTQPRMYLNIVGLYLFTTIFAILFDVCALLYNPFGPRDFDIQHHVVGRGIRQLGRSLSDGEGCNPDTFDEDGDENNVSSLRESVFDDRRSMEMNLEMARPQNARTALISQRFL